jgi:hypothetical protein
MKGQVHEEILSDIRNKLTVPKMALESKYQEDSRICHAFTV